MNSTISDVIELIRASVRPIVTLWFDVTWVLFLISLYESGMTIVDMPAVFTWVMILCNAWYFGDRTWVKSKFKVIMK